MTDPAKKPDAADEEHVLAELIARLRAELAVPSTSTLPLPPDDAPTPPTPWSDGADEGEGD